MYLHKEFTGITKNFTSESINTKDRKICDVSNSSDGDNDSDNKNDCGTDDEKTETIVQIYSAVEKIKSSTVDRAAIVYLDYVRDVE